MPGVVNRERLSAAAVAALLLTCVLLIATRGRIDSDLQGFMPAADRLLPAEVASLAFDGPGERLILAAVSGGDADARVDASRALADALADAPEIARVLNGPDPKLAAAVEDLRDYRYLLSPAVTPERFAPDALRRALSARLRELASPLGGTGVLDARADPTGEFRTLVTAAAGRASGVRRVDGVWVSADGERSPLVIELSATASTMDAKAAVIDAIHQRFDTVGGNGGLQLTLSGSPVFAVHSRDVIRSEVQRLSIAATVLMVLILGWFFRSLRAVVLMGLPLVAAILTGTAAVIAAFGSIHGIAFAFGVTLVGVAVDYPVHVFSHRRSNEPAHRCVRRIWPTLRLGVATTMLGYLAMVFTDITGLAQLGTFAIGGLLGAALVTRYLLPILIADTLPAVRQGRHRPLLANAPPRAGLAVLAAVAVLTILALWAQRANLWATDLAAMSPIPRTIGESDAQLRADLGVPDLRYLAVLRGQSAEQILQRSEALAAALEPLRQDGVFDAIDHPAGLLPSAATQVQRRDALPTRTVLATRLAPIAAELGFREGAFDAFLADIEASRQLAPLALDQVRKRGLGLLLEDRLFERNGRWFGLVRFQGVEDPLALADGFARNAPSGAVFIDSKRRVEAVLAQFRDLALERFAIGVLFILAMLTVGLGSPVAALRVALPALLAAPLAAGLLVSAGQHLSVFHLVSLLLVVGLGLDYALFFNRTPTDAADHGQTARALLICALSTLCVFGLLSVSQLAVLSEIGATVSLGALAALAFAWLSAGERPVNDKT